MCSSISLVIHDENSAGPRGSRSQEEKALLNLKLAQPPQSFSLSCVFVLSCWSLSFTWQGSGSITCRLRTSEFHPASAENFNLEFERSQRRMGLPRWLSGKEPACQCRRYKRCEFDPWVGRFPGEGHGNPLQYSCLENPPDRGAWQVTVHRVAQSWTQLKPLSAPGTDETGSHAPPCGWVTIGDRDGLGKQHFP